MADLQTKILQKIEPYEYISFDIFDTLLKRNVQEPKDIFFLLQEEGEKKFGSSFAEFQKERIDAERLARQNKAEVTLKEIYQELTKFSHSETEWMMKRELELEYKYSAPNFSIRKIFRKCLQQEKNVIIVSDMYLPRENLENMLRKIGIDGYKKLYISNESRKTKANGELFALVTKDLNIDPEQIIHIGDNRRSDFVQAKKAGWNAVLINRWYDHLQYYNLPVTNMQDRVLREIMNNYAIDIPLEQRLGFETLGTLLYGFNMWLKEQVRKEEIKRIFFLSRDGLIIKKAFDIINNGEFETHYLYASRRALQVPVLADEKINLEVFSQRMHWPPKISIGYFLYALGIDTEKIKAKVEKKYGDLNQSVDRDNLLKSSLFRRIFAEEQQNIRANAKDERHALVQYFKQEKFGGKIAIVDIGWHGNMQLNLEEVLEQEEIPHDIYGYYIGVKPFNNHKDRIRMQGYIFDDGKNVELFTEEKYINGLFEQVFMANHGSVKRLLIDEKDSVVRPVLYPEEQVEPQLQQLITNYQAGALRLSSLMLSIEFDNLEITSKFAGSGIVAQFTNPTYLIAKRWGDVIFKDEHTAPLIAGKKGWKYIFTPKKFLVDYKKSVWKEGFLKLNFKKMSNPHKLVVKIAKIRGNE